jgi:hypothetical protein
MYTVLSQLLAKFHQDLMSVRLYVQHTASVGVTRNGFTELNNRYFTPATCFGVRAVFRLIRIQFPVVTWGNRTLVRCWLLELYVQEQFSV